MVEGLLRERRGLRQTAVWLHRWVGLLAGWVLFFVFLTGTTGYFDSEIGRWMRPELPFQPRHAEVDDSFWVQTAQDYLSRHAADAQRWAILMPDTGGDDRGPGDWRVSWPGLPVNGEHGESTLRLNPLTGRVLPDHDGARPRDTGGGIALYRLHYELRYMPLKAAIYIVGAATMAMLLALVTGIITHKKIFTDFFTFRPSKGQRSWLDAHNLISVCALPFFMVMTVSGLFFFADYYLPAGMKAAYGANRAWAGEGFENPLNPRANRQFDPAYQPDPAYEVPHAGSGKTAPLADLHLPLRDAEKVWGRGSVLRLRVEHPGQAGAQIVLTRKPSGLLATERLFYDGETGQRMQANWTDRRSAPWAVQDSFTNLHEAMFATWPLRWFYFFSGLLGSAMIATGLILWTTKRRQKQAVSGCADPGFRLAETLNITTIAGLPLAMAAFFWANRLLPAAMPERSAWEFHCLFIIWVTTLPWAWFRPPGKAWVEVTTAAGAAFALLPLLNALTTDKHLAASIAARDWALAGFDLTVLTLGIALLIAACMTRRAWPGAGKALL